SHELGHAEVHEHEAARGDGKARSSLSSLTGDRDRCRSKKCERFLTLPALFSEKCRSSIENVYRSAMREMRGVPYALAGDTIEALAFLQETIATALWKHRCNVGKTLESFAREFDRLDVREERKRLHAVTHKS
ncbi:MAG TPA: hypothetical protein VIL43_01830, partial [Burkholderiales bacterium]